MGIGKMRGIDTDLTTRFSEFAGKEVNVIEYPETLTIGGKEYDATEYEIAENDPVIQEFIKAANGLTLRFMFPNEMATLDHDRGRVTVNIKKDEQGIWRIQEEMRIG